MDRVGRRGWYDVKEYHGNVHTRHHMHSGPLAGICSVIQAPQIQCSVTARGVGRHGRWEGDSRERGHMCIPMADSC